MLKVDKPRPNWSQIVEAYRRQDAKSDVQPTPKHEGELRRENIFRADDTEQAVEVVTHSGKFPNRLRVTTVGE